MAAMWKIESCARVAGVGRKGPSPQSQCVGPNHAQARVDRTPSQERKLLDFARHILSCHNLPGPVSFEPSVRPRELDSVLSSARLNADRAFAAIQYCDGVAEKVNRDFVHGALFFGSPAQGMLYSVLL